MVKVYPSAVEYLFGPLIGLADEGFELDARLRPRMPSEIAVKKIYETELKGYYATLDPCINAATKLSLRYVLFKDGFNYRGEYNAMLLPFACPDDPRNAYLWLWEVLFPNETPTPIEAPCQVVDRIDPAREILGY